MQFTKVLLQSSFLFIFLVGCSSATSNPTPGDFLKNDSADIFLLDEYVFSNAQDLEWVIELEYEFGEQIGEITKQADKAFKFKNG